MPHTGEVRTFNVLERKGLVSYVKWDGRAGAAAGYIVTDAGRAALEKEAK
jgi:DNA-binding PadR family transcriptional regulator